MSAQAGAQLTLLIIQIVGRFGITYAQSLEGLGGSLLGNVTGFDHGGFQRTPQGFIEGQSSHQKVTGPSLILSRICCFTSASQVSTSASVSNVLRGRLMRCSLGCSS
ncbi:hypothetical protein D3C84_750290 [compost metagenome]